MTYIAQIRLKVGHDDETDTPVYREHGEEIPEAHGWPWQTRHAYERDGRIRFVPDASAAVAPTSPAKGTRNAKSA